MAIKQPTPPSSDPAATAAAASTSNSIPAGKPSSTKVYDNDYIQNPLLERLTYVAENAKMSGSRPRTGQKQQQQQTSEFIPDYRPILVHIVVPDNNLKRRRLVQKIDPDTGIIYSGAQIEASWKLVKAKPSSREGEEGMVDEDGNPIDSEEEKPAEEEQPEEEEEEEEEEDGGDGEEKTVPEINEDDYINTDDSPTEFEKKKKKLLKMAPVEEKNLKISNKTAWDIIPESVLRR